MVGSTDSMVGSYDSTNDVRARGVKAGWGGGGGGVNAVVGGVEDRLARKRVGMNREDMGEFEDDEVRRCIGCDGEAIGKNVALLLP